MTPLVSVIIPAYNAEKYLHETIESVYRQENATFEVIVIDDGSTDRTRSRAEAFRSRPGFFLLQHEGGQNLGVAVSRKLGVMRARGKYVAMLDADDLFLPGKLQKQVAALEERPDVVLCHTAVGIIDEIHSTVHSSEAYRLSEQIYAYAYPDEPYFLRANMIVNSSVLLRKSALEKVVFPKKQLFQYEDWLLWVLMSEQGKFIFLPDELLRYRLHDASSTASLIRQTLKVQYSTLEFLLSLLVCAESNTIKERINPLLRDVIIQLIAVYESGASDAPARAGTGELIRKIFYDGPDQEVRVLESRLEECQGRMKLARDQLLALENDHAKLRKDSAKVSRQLEGIKKSSFWLLYTKMAAVKSLFAGKKRL